MAEAKHTGAWSAKNDILLVEAHAEQKWNRAIVEGDPSSNDLVALVFGYSPEGVIRRADRLVTAVNCHDELVNALEAFVSDPTYEMEYAGRMETACRGCDAINDDLDKMIHTHDCAVVMGRAALAKWARP